MDTLILGCTHYPILKRIIGPLVGDDVILIDSGRESARFCAAQLAKNGLLSDRETEGEERFFVSDRTDDFTSVAGIFLGNEATSLQAELVQIEDY